MIYYKISYYNGKYLLGGQFLEEKQLKSVKYLVDLYLELYKEVNIRMESKYNPDSIKQNLEIRQIEVS